MTRPLRLEFPGALYHVTARGDRRTVIYLDEDDRRGARVSADYKDFPTFQDKF